MLPLLAAILLLAIAFRLLLRPRSSASLKSGADATADSALSTVQKKLLEEAFEHSDAPDATDGSVDAPAHPVLILYATEYGFACQVARAVAAALAAQPEGTATAPRLIPRVVNLLHYKVVDFTREPLVALVCSTTGDGVSPNEAAAFRDALVATDVVIPASARVAVLALGDRAYPHFCRAGAIFDALLPEGVRLMPRVDVDQEDWDVINAWTDSLRASITAHITAPSAPAPPPPPDYLRAAIDKYSASLDAVEAQYTLNNPFHATVLSRRSLTGPATKPGHKTVLRVEFDLAGSSLQYQVGDALAIIPRNNPEHVDRLLRTIASNGDELVRLSDSSASAQPVRFDTALTDALDINTVRPQLIVFLARHSGSSVEVGLAHRVLGRDPRDPSFKSHNSVTDFGKAYLAEREIYDVLMDFTSATLTAQQLVNTMRPLHARYYSISSTPVAEPGRVAVTVDVLRYTALNISREGVASSFLDERCRIGDTKVGLFLSKNPNFRLPADGAVPIIMVGPGTGIAPFVAFLAERHANKATGENWLFFGCRFERQDFLYGDELRKYAGRGFLRLRTAFSRDGPEKVYVQKRITECAKQLWTLIDEQGAHVYVCGDGGKMASDVDETLKGVAESQGGMSADEAVGYFEKLAEAKRYQRDVWVS